MLVPPQRYAAPVDPFQRRRKDEEEHYALRWHAEQEADIDEADKRRLAHRRRLAQAVRAASVLQAGRRSRALQ